jgi:hypothetical protein
MKRALRAAWWLSPPLLFLALYWPGLWIWFHQDDFAWLNLNLRLKEGYSLWRLLLEPAAQGTIRPLSERLFFIGFFHAFGLDAFPYRALVYATQVASLLLLAAIARRLTGSKAAGFWAALFWMANAGTAASLAWTSTYNQILCAFFVLLAFYWFVRYVETGRRGYYGAQGAAFLAGFGALELNAVYPAAALCYALARNRRCWRSTVPLFAVSAVYALVHNAAAPKPTTGPYAIHLDLALPATLWRYWTYALGATDVTPPPARLGWAVAWSLTLILLGFLASELAHRRYLAAFPVAWFLVFLAPVLPLRDHFTGYYLTIPAIGLGLLGGEAFASAWNRSRAWKALALGAAAFYLGVSLPVGQSILAWRLRQGRTAQRLLLGVEAAQRRHPEKVLLLRGVNSDMFWFCVKDRPFRLVGAPDVWLAPGSEAVIEPHPELAHLDEYILAERPTSSLLKTGQAVVYDVSRTRPRNVTQLVRAALEARGELPLARRIDAGRPWFSEHFLDGWQPIERGYRWMGRRATVRLGGPQRASEQLEIEGFCPARQIRQGPLRLAVAVEGGAPESVEIRQGDAAFRFRFPLRPELVGREWIDVTLEVDRTFWVASEQRLLGLAFGTFAVR